MVLNFQICILFKHLDQTSSMHRYLDELILCGKYFFILTYVLFMTFSLGASILEVASALELPGNGPLWHSLRSSCIPEEFRRNLSSNMSHLIGRMMQPSPPARPTTDDILQCPFIKMVSLLIRTHSVNKSSVFI